MSSRIQAGEPGLLLANQSWPACLHRGQLNTPQPPLIPDTSKDHKTSSSSSTRTQDLGKGLAKQEGLIQRSMGACSSTSLYSGTGRVKCPYQCDLCLAKCPAQGSSTLPSPVAAVPSAVPLSGNGWLPLWKTNHLQ